MDLILLCIYTFYNDIVSNVNFKYFRLLVNYNTSYFWTSPVCQNVVYIYIFCHHNLTSQIQFWHWINSSSSCCFYVWFSTVFIKEIDCFNGMYPLPSLLFIMLSQNMKKDIHMLTFWHWKWYFFFKYCSINIIPVSNLICCVFHVWWHFRWFVL